MFLILLLPMALGQTSLRGREVKVTTVAHRPFIMPNNLSSGERWPEKFHEIVHHVLFVIVMACISGERKFPFPVIPGNTSLKFPVPSLPVAF